jgi:mannobiose 2-epimerase
MSFDPLSLADELDASLWQDLIAPWFPACVDPSGGFFQNFSRDWMLEESPEESAERGLVFQSRMTWLSATLAETGHARAEEFRSYALHGLQFLAHRFAEAGTGSLYWAVDAHGPAGPYARQRHSYGVSFAIYAFAAVYRATGEALALELAQRAFGWLERYAYDKEHGGYFECTDEAGNPLLALPPGWTGKNRDAIGTPYGLKSQNTHLHLLESFTELARVWPDEKLRERLVEVTEILTQRLLDPNGWLHLFVYANWRPVPGPVSYGHDVEAAHLLMDAAEVLFGEVDATIGAAAGRLIADVLKHGRDLRHGGIYNLGSSDGEPTDRTKVWWVQAEALLGLARGLELPMSDRQAYEAALVDTWRWIREHQIDPVHGGWFGYLSEAGHVLGQAEKGDMWKAAYHDGRALLFAARALRRVSARAA